MTPKQEKFVQNLIKGMSQRKAYQDAYPKSKKWEKKAVDSRASSLLKNDKVLERYNELQKKAEDKAILSATERKVWLSNIISGKQHEKVYVIKKSKDGSSNSLVDEQEASLDTKMKALDLLNKMDGEYIEKKDMKLETSDFTVNIKVIK